MEDPDETATVETDDEQPADPDTAADTEDPDENAETFPRTYVEKLRRENKTYRDRAKTAEANLDTTLRELFTARVTATAKLADPDDLAYDAELLADEDKLSAAIDELIARKPHLAARKVSGSVGQGISGKSEEPFSLIGRLQRSA